MTVSLQQASPAVTAGPRVRTVRIAVAGCGVVGGAFLRLIAEQRDDIAARHGLLLEPVAVLVRNPGRPRPGIPLHLRPMDEAHAFSGVEADLLVEATGCVDTARSLALASFRRRRGFVTANKALLAAHGEELLREAAQARTYIGAEAAVAGGAPVIRTLVQSAQHARVTGVTGILNGTTNFILNRLADGVAADEALREAQHLGFAEADPTRDLEGQDAEDKLRILAWLAFGVGPARLVVHRQGIDGDVALLNRTAAAAGATLRLLASARLDGEAVVASVEPVAVHATSPFARVAAEDNVVLFETADAGRITVTGPGAGGSPTAVSLLADVLRPFALTLPGVQRRATPDTSRHDWLVGAAREHGPLVGSLSSVSRAVDGAGGPSLSRRSSQPLLQPLPGAAGISLWRLAGATRAQVDALRAGVVRAAGREPVVLRVSGAPAA